MRSAVLLLVIALFSPALLADDHIVDFDQQADFSAIRTFVIRDTSIRINRPELRSPLLVKQTTDAIRAALTSKGLKEVAGNADVIVESTLGGQGFVVGEGGRARPINEQRGGRWEANQGGQPESFLEGLLVIDLTAQSSGLLIWRGVYRDKEPSPARLAEKLPGDIKKLFAAYPPGKK